MKYSEAEAKNSNTFDFGGKCLASIIEDPYKVTSQKRLLVKKSFVFNLSSR